MDVIKSVKLNKNPVPDGFPIDWYKILIDFLTPMLLKLCFLYRKFSSLFQRWFLQL